MKNYRPNFETTPTPLEVISNPNRVRILIFLLEGEMSTRYIEIELDIPRPSTIRHLQFLKKAKLINSGYDRPHRLYRLTPTGRKLASGLAKLLP